MPLWNFFAIDWIGLGRAQRGVNKMSTDLMPKKIKINSAFSLAANFTTKHFKIKFALGLYIGDRKGQMKRGRKTGIDKLLQKTTGLILCTTPFNKIVGDLGTLGLHTGMWRLATSLFS